MSEPSQAAQNAQSSRKLPSRATAALVGASAAVGGLVMVIANLVLSRDPAGDLAATFGLSSGTVLAASLGGLLGGWLVFGGSRRIAATAGFFYRSHRGRMGACPASLMSRGPCDERGVR